MKKILKKINSTEQIDTDTYKTLYYEMISLEPVTVTLNANGGTISQNELEVLKGKPIGNIPTPIPPTGKEFDGWYTDLTGGIIVDNTYIVNNDITIYARYTDPVVSFDTDGGTSIESQEIAYGQKATRPANNPTKEGYTFNNWYTDNTYQTIFDFNNTIITTSKTIYAKFIPNQYTIVYNGNENTSGSTENSTHTYDVSKNLTTNGYTKEGYAFIGWNTKEDGSGEAYLDGESIINLTSENNGEITLYAQWIINTYTIEYNGNGSTGGSTESSTHTYGVAKNLTANGFTRTGYTFAGWNTKEDGSGTSYTDEQSITNLTSINNATVELYAQWILAQAMFEDGQTVNEKMIKLAYNSASLITEIKKADDVPSSWKDSSGNITAPSTNNIVSVNTTSYPTSIYMWYTLTSFYDDTGIIYWYSEDLNPNLNFNSSYMFSSFSVTSLDLSNFNTSEVTNMTYMFQDCSSLTSLELSNFNTSEVTNMQNMFQGCSKLTSLDLSNFDTSEVTNMTYMFQDCSSLTSLDLSNFDKNKVTDMTYMFQGCSKLTSLDLSHFNTSEVTDMTYMFQGCSKLTSLDLSHFNTSEVTNMTYMFQGCSSLTSLNLSNFNTSQVTNMASMFMNDSSLTSLDLSNFNTIEVTTMTSMFRGCSKLTSLDLSNFNTSKVTNMSICFIDCSSLTSLDLK